MHSQLSLDGESGFYRIYSFWELKIETSKTLYTLKRKTCTVWVDVKYMIFLFILSSKLFKE